MMGLRLEIHACTQAWLQQLQCLATPLSSHIPTALVSPLPRRGASAGAEGGDTADGGPNDADDDADARAANRRAAAALLADDNAELTPAQAAKKARVSAMFEQLHQASTGSANKLSKSTISLASLCSNTDPKKKRNTDAVSVWKHSATRLCAT